MNKRDYERLPLKNGWDLPAGEKPPMTGRKRWLARAYELLVLKDDAAYGGETAAGKEELSEKKQPEKKSSVQPKDCTAEDARVQGEEKPAGREDPLAQYMISPAAAAQKKKKRRRRLLVIVLAAVMLIGGRIAFGPPILTADISGYKDVKITVVGIRKKPFTITAGTLARMKKASLQVDVPEEETPQGEEPERGKAIGPTLKTFLAHYDKTTDDYKALRVYTENGDSNAYVRSMKEQEIILSIANGSKPLLEKQAPLRIAVDDQEADAWTGWVRKLEFIK